MPLKDIQPVAIIPAGRAEGEFVTTAYSSDGTKSAAFGCSGEYHARALHSAILRHASCLKSVLDSGQKAPPLAVPNADILKDALRSSGWLTHSQAWDVAEYLHGWLSTAPLGAPPPYPGKDEG
jgi:hypothetical protein